MTVLAIAAAWTAVALGVGVLVGRAIRAGDQALDDGGDPFTAHAEQAIRLDVRL